MNKNNKLGFFMLLVALSLVGFSPLSKIYLNEPITNGQENEIYVAVNNDLNRDFEDSIVKIFIYDLGTALYSQSFDLQSQDNALARLYWTPRNIPAGNYLARVEVSNDRFRDWEHIYLPVR